jgi:iron(III) transport system ATP-binding protein
MGNILFKNIWKSFDGKNILKDINIEIKDGELFTFLGPSGCGKTTLLRILAGFEKPDSGSIEINKEDITDLIPEKRSISMVFQNYALFPHMNVFENVSYGLRIRGIKEKVRKEKAEHCLKMVRLEDFAKRDINDLSGGEQQRVAIARALAIDPKVLLLDEPLSNLDAKLREKTRMEIRELQKNLGISTIFVTHDQQEAMSISDRIAVFNNGKIVQAGSPDNIYNHPKDEFVASFIGDSNIIDKEDFGLFSLSHIDANKICIRPQDISICEDGKIPGEIISIEFKGSFITYHCMIEKVKVKAMEINNGDIKKILPGELVKLRINEDAIKGLIS